MYPVNHLVTMSPENDQKTPETEKISPTIKKKVGFFAKLTKNIHTFSNKLFSPEKLNSSALPDRRSSGVYKCLEDNLALNIKQFHEDVASGTTKIVLEAELSEDEECTVREATPSSCPTSTAMIYDRSMLLLLRKSPLSQIPPQVDPNILKSPLKDTATKQSSPNGILNKQRISFKGNPTSIESAPLKDIPNKAPNQIKISANESSQSKGDSTMGQLASQLSLFNISSNESSSVSCKKYGNVPNPRNTGSSKVRYYKTIPLDPQIHEILSGPQHDIYRNIVEGPYKSPVHYLNIQVKLLREDFIAPLREGIQQMRSDLTDYGELCVNENVTLYPKCCFISMSARKKIVGYEFCFDVDFKMKNNRWKTARSLCNGTLLAFSCDNFQTFFFGFIAQTDDHDMLYRRTIVVELCNGRHLDFSEFNQSYAMIEPSSFFAPYFYVIKTLQTFSNENFPFEKYVINVKWDINPPAYFSKSKGILESYDLGPSIQEELGLNTVQFEAYKTALTRELAIIQGPPGTGKTYVGLRIVETLLKNEQLMRHMDGPILVVCYTNHALDQFVEGVLKYTQNVCRLGYSRKNTKVKPYNYLVLIETFFAIEDIVKSSKKGGKKNKFVDVKDFDQLFQPDTCGNYLMRVRSFKSEVYETRKYSAQLMKAYFFMYTKSPFNLPKTVPKKSVMKYCHRIENRIERISTKISLVNSFNGIVHVKHLEDVMDDTSSFVFKASGSLVEWLLNENFRTSPNHAKTKFEENQILTKNESDDEYDFDDMSLSEESVADIGDEFYSLDLTIIRNEIEDTEAQLKELIQKNKRTENRYLVNMDEIEMQRRIKNLQNVVQTVKGMLNYFKESNVNMKEIESNIIKNIASSKDLTCMEVEDRWKLYWYWVESYRRDLYAQMKGQGVEYRRILRQFEDTIRNPELLQIMKTKDVVAMTTTKAAKIHSVLCQLKPKIVVIEEAAEVMESHILASLSKHCEHLVLIGDHKQLRPRPSVHELGRDFYLDVSLFERLVNNELHHVTLEVQHRMRPEICELLTPSIYDNLINHASVLKLPNIMGMPNNVQFFDHKVCEGHNSNEHSTWNKFEVDILLNLSAYLLKQGYRTRDITIIAAYSGQVELFEDVMNTRYKYLENIRVTTIDAFQGEENKIILLSLVRSNVHNNIGFLKTPNRVCVALSRAKQGLYIMGNMKCLSLQSDLWMNIKNTLKARRALNENFRLTCGRHRATTIIRAVEDFESCCCLRY